MVNKPIPKGYKLIALCSANGYCLSLFPVSPVDKTETDKIRVPCLTNTESIVVHLLKSLDLRRKDFILVCDNYYSTIRLFWFLKRLGIGAVGTIRWTNVPKPLKEMVMREKNAEWGTVFGQIHQGVLA